MRCFFIKIKILNFLSFHLSLLSKLPKQPGRNDPRETTKMSKKLNEFIHQLKEQLELFLSISFGVFLFVLFFQPFELERFDFNNRLLLVAGLAGIVFLLMIFVQMVFPRFIPSKTELRETAFHYFLSGFLLMALSATAFAFYLRFVGEVNITFYVMIKIVIICLAPPLVLRLHKAFIELKTEAQLLLNQNKLIEQKIKRYQEDILTKSIEFTSENNGESFTVINADILLIKSADNYVEIFYMEGEHLKNQLLRNTLKRIEQHLKAYPNLMRCHRTFIVNSLYAEKLLKSDHHYQLSIKHFPDPIPVSRQYLLKIRELF